MAKLEILVGPEDPARVEQCQAGQAPRLDYRQIAECYETNIHHWRPPSGSQGSRLVSLFRSLFGNLHHAVRLANSLTPDRAADSTIVYSTGETWGLPMSFAGTLLRHRRFTHIVYVHKVFSPAWLRFLRITRRLLRVDGWICVTRHQAELLTGALGASGKPIAVVPQGVDTRFFDPVKATVPGTLPPYVLSVGAEMRNYDLLFDAVRNLDVQVVVKASSSWTSGGRAATADVPRNVKVISRRLSYIELRDLYAGAGLVVVPLLDSPQAAGITTILEAMAMGKCVLATDSSGLPDCLVDGRTGIICECSSEGLKDEITRLLNLRTTRCALGAAGREVVTSTLRIEDHASQVLAFIERMSGGVLL